MQFNQQQIEQFRTEGYLAVPDFWKPEEIAAMRIELEVLQSKGLLNNVATEGDGKTKATSVANLQLCPMSPHSNLFRAISFAPKVIDSVEQLIGGPIVLQLDQVFIKPAKHGSGTNWHQDNAYFQIKNPLHGTALWTAVHDANLSNGTIRVIPKSFHEPLEHTRDPQSNHHIRCYPDESQAVPIELKAGGAVFFAYGTPHATGANTTETDRAGVALHFLNQAAVPTDGSFETGRNPILSGPNRSTGEKEYGKVIAGTWENEVAMLLEK
jgi:phytanoyl-CoA hydroxylase